MLEPFHPSPRHRLRQWRKAGGSTWAAFLRPVLRAACWVDAECAPGLCSSPGCSSFSLWDPWLSQGLATSKGVQ